MAGHGVLQRAYFGSIEVLMQGPCRGLPEILTGARATVSITGKRKRTRIPWKTSSRAHDVNPIFNLMSTLNMALLSMILTGAHMALNRGTRWVYASSARLT